MEALMLPCKQGTINFALRIIGYLFEDLKKIMPRVVKMHTFITTFAAPLNYAYFVLSEYENCDLYIEVSGLNYLMLQDEAVEIYRERKKEKYFVFDIQYDTPKYNDFLQYVYIKNDTESLAEIKQKVLKKCSKYKEPKIINVNIANINNIAEFKRGK